MKTGLDPTLVGGCGEGTESVQSLLLVSGGWDTGEGQPGWDSSAVCSSLLPSALAPFSSALGLYSYSAVQLLLLGKRPQKPGELEAARKSG